MPTYISAYLHTCIPIYIQIHGCGSTDTYANTCIQSSMSGYIDTSYMENHA